MNHDSPLETLRVALEAAAGRAPAAAAPAAWLAHAARLVSVRRRLLCEEGCPVPVVRRAEALFAAEGARARAPVLLFRLVFDSFAGAAAVRRGTGSARTLRYEEGDLALDVRVSERPGQGRTLQVVLEPAPDEGEVLLTPDLPGRARRIALDASGVGRLALSRRTRAVVLEVRRSGRAPVRTPRLELEG